MKKQFIISVLFTFLLISCQEVFFEDDISNELVEITAPSDNVELNTGEQTFSWNTIEGADEYIIQIATPSFQNASQIIMDSVTIKTSLTKELNANNYQWRVKALNSAYETAYTTFSFSVLE